MNKKVGKISEKISEKKFALVETKNSFGAFKGKDELYGAKEVDSFLIEIGTDVLKLEGLTKRLYDENKTFKEKNGENVKVESDEATTNETVGQTKKEKELQRNKEIVSERVEVEVKDQSEGISKVQQQMVAFLEQAEAQSVEILREALDEKEQVLKDAEHQARKIVAEAMNQANEEKRRIQEKIDQTKEANERMQEKAQKMQRDIMHRVGELDKFGKDFTEFSSTLKAIAQNEKKKA